MISIKKKSPLFRVLLLVALLPVTVFLVNQETNFLGRAYYRLTGKKANLIVNLTPNMAIDRKVEIYLSQGGEEKGGMLKSVVRQVKTLKPEYIRIDHIYDFYYVVERNDRGLLEFNWIKLDAEIADILATGAKLFLSLSYMPPALSRGSEVDLPINWSEWEEVVRKTIEHVSGAGGLGISDVYYEVWNEPDLFGDFKMGKGKDYRELYKYAALGARQAQNTRPFKFGGPATTGLYKAWFDGLLSYVRNNNLRLDFYSWHRYSKFLKDFENDLTNASIWLENYPKYSNIEFIISESGFTSENDPGYDNVFSAIHTIGLYSLASEFEEMHKIFTFEIKDGPGDKQYWGRWGILTNEKFGKPLTKPRYNALEFLHLLEGVEVPVYGQGTWVKAFSARTDKSIKLLVVNYDAFGKHYENVPILFVGLPFRKFTFRRDDFLGGRVEYPVTNSSENWRTEFLMKPNSASIFEIIPLD